MSHTAVPLVGGVRAPAQIAGRSWVVGGVHAQIQVVGGVHAQIRVVGGVRAQIRVVGGVRAPAQIAGRSWVVGGVRGNGSDPLHPEWENPQKTELEMAKV